MRYVDIFGLQFDLLKLGALLTVVAVVLGSPLYWFVLRVPPPLDAQRNFASQYDPSQNLYTYPFRDATMKESFAKVADERVFKSGAEVSSQYPTLYGSNPAAFGTPAKMYVWFPGTLDSASEYSYTADGYRYYRAVVVPPNDPAGFRGVKDALTAAQGSINALTPVTLGFKEGTEPQSKTEFALVYGLYYWGTRYQNTRVTTNSPTFLVGSYEPIQESAISDPPDNVLPSGTVLRSGSLTITVHRVEFGAKYTRVLITVDNAATEPVDWAWGQGAFIRADDTSFRPAYQETSQDTPNDLLPTTFQPAQTTGYMFFDRLTPPKNRLEMLLPLPAASSTVKWTQAFNLNNLSSGDSSDEVAAEPTAS